MAYQLAMRGYDDGVVKNVAKRLPSNQSSALRAALRDMNRAHTADMLGFDAVPAPQPTPLPTTTTWWKRLFG